MAEATVRDDDRAQAIADKYNLTPILMEDKIDGSDVEAVDWSPVVPVLESLTAQLRAAQATIAEIEAHVDRQAERGHEAADSFVLRRILSRADTSALAAVKAEALEEFARKLSGEYTLNFESAGTMHEQIVRLLKRDAGIIREAVQS